MQTQIKNLSTGLINIIPKLIDDVRSVVPDECATKINVLLKITNDDVTGLSAFIENQNIQRESLDVKDDADWELIMLNRYLKPFLYDLKSIKILQTIIDKIDNFDEKIVKQYSFTNGYIPMSKIIDTKVTDTSILRKNIDLVKMIPMKILSEIKLIPILDIYAASVFDNFELFQKIKARYGYIRITLRILNNLFIEVTKKKCNNSENDGLFNEIRSNVRDYGSESLNTTIEEVINELSTGECGIGDVVSSGFNNINEGKVFGMAKKVADKLVTQVQEGKININDLVNSSRSFITNMMASDMFKDNPNSSQVKNMFNGLLSTVEKLSDANKEDEESKDIDDIIAEDV